MGTIHLGVLIVFVTVGLSVIGLLIIRRTVSLSFLQQHHEVAGFIIGVLGAIYGVLLAFVVVTVWEQFEGAKIAVSNEANQLSDLTRITRGFSPPVPDEALKGIQDYAQIVIQEEWPTMSEGKMSLQAQSAADRLWEIIRDIEPKTNRENALYDEALERLSRLSDARNARLHACKQAIPTVVWIVMWSGGIITIVFTYFFGVESIRSQVLMTIALSGEIALILFLVITLDNPFKGTVSVSPEPLQNVLEMTATPSAE